MAGSFDDKSSNSDQAGKRPTPTIEGTAKEVSVESEDKATDETPTEKTESDETRAPPSESGEDAPATEPNGSAATQSEEGRRSFGASLLAALTSFTTHAAAGLLGGALVLVGMGLGYVPTPTSTDPDEAALLKARIAKLEAAPQTPDSSAALKTLETRLAGLESKTPDTPPELASLAERVDQLDASLKSMADAVKDGGSVADAAAIGQQINAAEARLDAKINETLAKTAGADGASIAGLKKEVAGLEAKLKALTEAELGKGEASRLAPEVAELDERLDRLESTLPPLLEAVDKEAADTKAATLAMAFANLRASVDAGRPYATELSTLAALSPGAGDIGPLLEYEDDGIPTLRQLTVSFKETRDKVPAAPSADDDTFLNRLMSSAESLVKVKRVDGAAEGATPDAVLARAEAKLAQGDLAAAAAEVGTLQGPARTAFAKWLDQARARLDAEETLQRLQKILLVSLGRNAPSVSGKTKEEPQEQN
ncbi:MAG: COG4223 family protein [Alphaproteobacteria bacterium]